MIPTIGFMIGAYIIARSIDMMNISRPLTIAFSVIALVVATYGVAELLNAGMEAQTQAQAAQESVRHLRDLLH